MCYTNERGNSYSFLDPLPNDAGHFVAVAVDNGVRNLDFSEGRAERALS